MSGNNAQKSKSPRPIAPAPEKSQPSSSSSLAALSASVSFIAQGNEINGKRKLAPRPSDESVKHSSLIKIQPNISKKDSPPSNNGNSNIINNVRLAPAPQQATTAAASTASSSATSSSSTAAAAPTAGQMMTGSFVLRPVSNQNQRMFPFFSAAAASAHPHLQQRLQATIDANGNIINASNNNNNNNQGHQILTENQLHQLQQHHQRNISINQQQQQQQQRPPAPIPIAPRPSSLAPTPSTSEAIPSSSSTSAATPSSTSTTSFGTIKPPKICPRPIEKKPIPNSQIPSSSAGSGSGGAATGAGMNLTPQSIIPTPQLNAGGALIGFAPNGQPIGYLPSALGVHLQNQQLRFIQPQTLARMQMSHLNPMSIFPHPQQIIHPGFLSAAGGNATYISQGIPNNNSQIPQYLSISGFNPNQIPTSFMNSINSQVSQQFHQQQQQHLQQQQQQLHLQQQQQQQQPKLIPITPNPSTSTTKIAPSMTMASAASTSSNLPPLIPRLPPIAPFVPSLTPAISLEAAKPLLLEATSDDDENEPPPLLDRDETVPPSVHEAFVQEAAGVRMQFPLLGTEGNEPLRHVIDGFVIEESSVPFEIDDVIKEPIEVIRQLVKQRKVKKEEEEMEDIKNESIKKIKKIKKSSSSKPEISQITGQVLKKRGRKSNNQNNISNNNVSSSNNNGSNKKQALRSPSPTKSNRKRSSSSTQNQQQQQNRRLSPTKSIKSPPPERPGSSKGPRKSREIEQLISMDFGPKNPVFKTTSVDEYTKEIKRRQQTSLRPVILQDYKERSPEISREGDEQQCLNCRFTFAQLKLRCEKYPQYCTKECRKEFRRSAKRARQELAEAKAADPSSSSSTSNINEMAAALIGKSPDNGNNGMRKRLSNESEASTVSHIPTKSSPLKIRIRSSTDLESPASSSQLLLSPPAASTSATMHHQQMMMMPGPSSTPIIMNMLNTSNTSNGSNGSIPPLASPPLPPTGPPPNPNIPDFARITEQAGLNPQDVNDWSAEDVGRWINAITNSQTNGEIFLTEEIDGSSLFMLTQNQMTSELKVKLGPTLKIVRAIEWLRNL